MKYGFVFTLTLVSLFAFQARADIGGIGSPVTPANTPKAQTQLAPNSWRNTNAPSEQDSATQASGETSPLLTITFNQRHVYFDRQLREAIDNTETRQAGATYVVVSTVPIDTGTGRTHVAYRNDTYGSNVDNVLKVMQDAGIPLGRIQFSTQSSDDVTAQEVSVSIK